MSHFLFELPVTPKIYEYMKIGPEFNGVVIDDLLQVGGVWRQSSTFGTTVVRCI